MPKKIGKLEIIVFTSGAVVMVLELIGSRILAPYLGNSIFVWSSLIGIILGALSLGYYLGGQFSLNNPRLKFLCGILFFAGLIILFIPIIKDPILLLVTKLGVKLGAVIATLALFTLPSVLLGMISPYTIRLKSHNIEKVGSSAGNLYAISTVGSIFGTFLAGFYLIPTFGSTQILFGLSFVLIVASLLNSINKIKIFSLFLIISFAFIFTTISSPHLFETDSAYNHIIIDDKTDTRTGQDIRVLFLATESHSIMYTNSDQLFSKYSQLYTLDNLFKPEIKNALVLGGGAYVFPVDFLKRYPEAEMTVVEIDPEVTQVARDYFRLKDNPRLKIYHQDARIFLNKDDTTYDVIYGDAFASSFSVPFQLTTLEALEKTSDLLVKDGVFILNMITAIQGKKSKFFQAEYKTLKQVFPQIYIFPAKHYQDKNLDKTQNVIVVASKNPERFTKDDLLKNATEKQKQLLEHFWQKEILINPDTTILTDNFAPVDYYISKLL